MVITLARALTRSRIILDELDKLNIRNYSGINSNEQDKKSFVSLKDKYNSLSEEYVRIKSAISKANVETHVDFKGEYLTISQLINKKVIMEKKSLLLTKIKTELNIVKRKEIETEEKVENVAEERIKNLGEVNPSLLSEISEQIYKSVRGEFAFTVSSCYGEGIELFSEKLEKDQEEVADFLNEIDFVLSEVNATTHIEV